MTHPTPPTEIEARFLVQALPDALETCERQPIVQGYILATDTCCLRLRRKGPQLIQTVKQGQGLTRTEVEIELSEAQFSALWPLTLDRRLTKTRYRVPLGGRLTAELDLYEGSLKGLATVEVEFDSEADYETFSRDQVPAWFGEEVTHDPRYLNQSLALDGLPGQPR